MGRVLQAWPFVVAVNLLNVADVLATRMALEVGAREWNPVVERWGFGWKLVWVAVASIVVGMVRRRWLWVPIVALSLVVGYTMAGVWVTGRKM